MAQWVAGQSGNPNGRPKGSRHMLAETVVRELLQDWGKHGMDVVEQVRLTKPEVYLQVISRLMPQSMELDVTDARRSVSEYSTGELVEILQDKPALKAG